MKLFGISGHALVAGLAGAGAMGAVVWGPTLLHADARPVVIEAPAGAPISLADLIEQVSPAVVSINVVSEQERSPLTDMERFFERFRNGPDADPEDDEDDGESPMREARSLGSGFFISADGLIVTNNHVVEGATEIEVVMEDGRELEAELVGRDAQTDLAVIRVKEGRDFDYVQFGSSQELRRGDWVVALGNPFGLGGTATSGIVSAIGKPGDRGRSSTYTDYLQIDAAINRGNSGGPTFDLYGRVIGVNTAILSPTGGSVGIGFAIPSDLAKTVTDKLITDGKVSRGWLGVTIQDLTDEMAEARGIPDAEGAIIADVTADSPAKEYGLKRGDIITEVNGTKVTDATSTTRVVGALLAGTDNRFVVLRAGKPTIVNVTVGERPENLTLASGDGPEDREEDSEDAETAPLGVSLRPLDEATRGDYNLEDEAGGMVVTDVERDSPFLEVSNLRPGMVILDVNGTPITSVEDMESEVAKARRSGRDKVLVAIYTGRQTAFLPVDIAGGDDE